MFKETSTKVISTNSEYHMTLKNEDKSTWAIGGGVVMGTGVGFFFLQTSALWFVGFYLDCSGYWFTHHCDYLRHKQ